MNADRPQNMTPAAAFSIADVERVLADVRPALARHGGGIDLVCVEGCNVRVSLRGACVGCPSSMMTLRESVERHLREELSGFGELIAEEQESSKGRFSSVLKKLVAPKSTPRAC